MYAVVSLAPAKSFLLPVFMLLRYPAVTHTCDTTRPTESPLLSFQYTRQPGLAIYPDLLLDLPLVIFSAQGTPIILRCHVWCNVSSIFIWMYVRGHNPALSLVHITRTELESVYPSLWFLLKMGNRIWFEHSYFHFQIQTSALHNHLYHRYFVISSSLLNDFQFLKRRNFLLYCIFNEKLS